MRTAGEPGKAVTASRWGKRLLALGLCDLVAEGHSGVIGPCTT